MKKIGFIIILLINLSLLGGCAEVLPEKVQVIVNEKADEVKERAVEELKDAFSNQIVDFIKNSDLKNTLGLSEKEEETVTNSFKSYLENYDTDSEEWKNALDALTAVIEELKEKGELDSLSSEELNNKLQKMIDKKPDTQ